MILEKINIIIRNKFGSIEEGDGNLSEIEIIDKYLNFTDIKVEKHHICLLRDYMDNDILFEEKLKLFSPEIPLFKKEIEHDSCIDCELNCFSNLNYNLDSSTLFFIMQIHNMEGVLSKQDKKKLSLEFFNQFYVLNGIWCYNPNRVGKLIKDYYLEFLNKSFYNRNAIENLKDLYLSKDILLNVSERFKNMSEEENFAEGDFLIRFINNKIEYYEKMYAIEKELKKPSLSVDENSDAGNFNEKTKKKKSEIVLERINEYGFSELEMLKDVNVVSLIEHIFIKTKLPYQIAYLWHLGFVDKIDAEQCNSQKELHKLLGRIIDADERAVRGNVNGIKQEKSTDRKRYTAYKHIEKVKKHYQTLK
ncbi:hypothetical protein LPB136_06890 [Tenacibaculum todarodis]|uniref:Uncharacterized protein n=1 Tax=Tenacibaculum todarodis TaxID=1850252 RepID=A0A1L3JJ00_9FLAO|nr:hypothetical protein [Tenacibaculum todarodis]APG65089.1 hypothetical protein LPB136_06890 [Tenacibaculum todarodis]